MFDIEQNRELLTNVFSSFQTQLHIYQKMYRYYMGVTDTTISKYNLCGDYINDNMIMDADTIGYYSYMNDRSKQKIGNNYIKKFIKEEVSYSVGNNVTYTSVSGDENIVDIIQYNTAHWKEDHESTLAKNMLIYGLAYELYYINYENEFCSQIVSPRHGIACTNDKGNIVFFLHITKQSFDEKLLIDLYTDDEIIHLDETFTEIDKREINIFGVVPVGIAELSEEGWLDTIYNDIKGLQDSFEINLSDISSEITEYRNAYLSFQNAQISDLDLPEMKQKGIICLKDNGKAEWLIKNINDSFVQNTLNCIEDKMYKLTAHINTNEAMQSNTSSLALRTRLISLEEKCKLNEKALTNCIKTRLKLLFIFLNKLKSTVYDYKTVGIKYTANIPSDDLISSQIIATLGDKLSLETGLAQLSFIDNPKEEIEKILAERKILEPTLDEPATNIDNQNDSISKGE